MTDLQFLLVFSVGPIGMLVIAAALFFLTDDGRKNQQPGE